MNERKVITVEIGTESVIIDKLYGPTIFANLRITPDIRYGWVIERQIIKTGAYVEWVTIPAQIDEEFIDLDMQKGVTTDGHD